MAQFKTNFWRRTRDFLMLGGAKARWLTKIRLDLEEVEKNTGCKISVVHQSEINSLKKIRKSILKDTNGLRLKGLPELALKVINAAQSLGITSPQLQVERAKSLEALNEHEKAVRIWEQQTLCEELEIKTEADDAIKHYEQKRYLASELLQSLKSKINSNKIEPKYLPDTAPYDLATLENHIINEAIELRKNNKNELSLQILEISSDAGLKTNLINENKARALFNMKNKREAVHIWQSLLSSQDEASRDSTQKILTRLSNDLLNLVKRVISNNNLPIHHLPNETPQDLSKLGVCILKEAIKLREEKQNEISLKILDITASAGFETDSINENRARALINLNRNVDAVNLLTELLSSKNQNINKSSANILESLGVGLIEKIKKAMEIDGLIIDKFPENEQKSIASLEKFILQQAIELRKNKRERLSLQILDLSAKAGLQTERIEDNRARALANMKRYGEAVTIWNSLANSRNEKLQESAKIMIGRFGAQGLQQQIMSEVDHILFHQGDQKQAIDLLTNAILQNPTDEKLQERLGQVAMMDKEVNENQEFGELSIHRQTLAGFEAFITTIEQLDKPALQGTQDNNRSKNNPQQLKIKSNKEY